ncbi:hypothetical protein ACEPAG_6289 [Sanghuangporus baumii]
MPLLPKFLKRKNSSRRGRSEQTPVVAARSLSPVQEVIHVPASDTGSPRPVPPPQLFHSHDDDYERHDLHHDDLEDDLHDPHSRLYETFSSAHSQDGHGAIPRVIREDDEPGHHHFDDHTDGIRSEHPGELGFVGTERSGQNPPTVFIAPSDHSGSSHSSSQKVTFIGDMRSHDRGTPYTQRRALSTSSRSMSRRVPVAPSTIRENYRSHRRHASESSYPSPPRMSRPEYRYEFRRPYLIFTDFGEGLEVGNEEDGFMRYQDFRDTAHLRANRDDTYYIIPGSTPVIFHDDTGNELYKVDAWKFNTPMLRRKQYIIEDENGRELFRVGGTDSSRYSSDGYSSGSYSSNLPKVQYLNSELGRQASH